MELKERLFSVFFLSAEALAKADVILRGYTNLKNALKEILAACQRFKTK
jgi:hypothetical protein